MLKKLIPIMATVLVLGTVFTVMPTMAESHTSTVDYTGQGFDSEGNLETEKCDPFDTGQASSEGLTAETGYLHWILAGSQADSATLTGPWGTTDMVKAGQGQGGAFHAATEFFALAVLIGAVHATHDGDGPNPQLTVSNGCPGEPGEPPLPPEPPEPPVPPEPPEPPEPPLPVGGPIREPEQPRPREEPIAVAEREDDGEVLGVQVIAPEGPVDAGMGAAGIAVSSLFGLGNSVTAIGFGVSRLRRKEF